MTGSTHALIGAAVAAPPALSAGSLSPSAFLAGGADEAVAGLLPVAAVWAVGMFSALLPDIDHPGSELGRYIHLPLDHRGPMHSLFVAGLWVFIAGVTSYVLVPRLTLAAAVVAALGFLSHLAADSINPSPMALFWPVVREKVRPDWLPAVSQRSLAGKLVESGVWVAILGIAVGKLVSVLS